MVEYAEAAEHLGFTLIAGVGPSSLPQDYALVGIAFEKSLYLVGREKVGFPHALGSMFSYVTEDRHEDEVGQLRKFHEQVLPHLPP